MSTLGKFIIVQIVVTLIVVGSITYLISTGANEYKKTINKYEDHLGKEYVSRGDTLKITDYSIIMERFTLSDGTTINSKLVLEK